VDKLTQKEAILELFALHGGKVTLGQILKTPLADEFRARFSEMRGQGYRIIYKRGVVPSENTYTLESPQESREGKTKPNVKLHSKADSLDCTAIGVRTNSKIDRLNRGLSPERVKELIERCEAVLLGYPESHKQREKINQQIEGLKA
jgi:hypothetical protein